MFFVLSFIDENSFTKYLLSTNSHPSFLDLFHIVLPLEPVSSVPSSAWMDHLWLGLINKSYEDYKKDNPYTALNQEVDMQVR